MISLARAALSIAPTSAPSVCSHAQPIALQAATSTTTGAPEMTKSTVRVDRPRVPDHQPDGVRSRL